MYNITLEVPQRGEIAILATFCWSSESMFLTELQLIEPSDLSRLKRGCFFVFRLGSVCCEYPLDPSLWCILMGRCGKLPKIIIRYSLLCGVLAIFYVFDNTLILFKFMTICDILSTSIGCECKDLGHAYNSVCGTTIKPLIFSTKALQVWPSVSQRFHYSCLLHNSDTVCDIFTKLHTDVKPYKTTCRTWTVTLVCLRLELLPFKHWT